MKKNIFVFYITLALCFSSCIWPKNEKELPIYKPDVLWTKKIKGCSFLMYPTQIDNYIYGISFEKKNNIRSSWLYKLDLNDGNIIWESETYESNYYDPPVVIKDKIFVYTNLGEILCFDESTGLLLSTLMLVSKSDMEIKKVFSESLVNVLDEYLCFSYKNNNHLNDDGIMRFKLTDIDFSKPPEEIQYIEPDLIWCGKEFNEKYGIAEYIYTHFAVENGIIYYLSTDFIPEGVFDATLGAIDVSLAKVKWEKKVKLEGDNSEALKIVGDNLYIIDYYAACYNKETGEPIWEAIQSEQDLMIEEYIAGQSNCKCGQFYSNGCLFYTTGEHADIVISFGCSKELVTNIKCLDLEKSIKNKKATLKWSYMPEGCASLGTRPIVTNGQVFVTAYNCGLYVFEEYTGKVVGVCKDYYFPGMERNFLYDGKVYFFDYDYENNVRTLVCFKP